MMTDTPNVMQTIMLFQQTKKRAQAAQDRAKAAQDQTKASKEVALEEEKDNDAAQKELQKLQRVMEPKRARTNATTVNDHEECDDQSSDDMDITDHRREATRIQKRRSVALGSREDVPTPQKGQAVPLEHSRLGLVGAEEEGNRVGCQGLTLGETRCVGLCVRHNGLDVHIRPGHHWLCEFGDAGNDTSCEKQFNLHHRKCEDYRGTHFYNKDSALAQQSGGGCVRTNVPRVDAGR